MRSGSVLAVICLQSAALQACLQSMYHARAPAEGPVRRYRPELEEEPIAGGYAVGCASYPVSNTFHICFIPRGGLSHALSSRSTRWWPRASGSNVSRRQCASYPCLIPPFHTLFHTLRFTPTSHVHPGVFRANSESLRVVPPRPPPLPLAPSPPSSPPSPPSASPFRFVWSVSCSIMAP